MPNTHRRRFSSRKLPLFIWVAIGVSAIVSGVTLGVTGIKASNLEPAELAVVMDKSIMYFWHDNQRHVGCWRNELGGMSCLPDADYQIVKRADSNIPVVIKRDNLPQLKE